jgi:hypothetical protein
MPRNEAPTNAETLNGLKSKGLDVWSWCLACHREAVVPVDVLLAKLPGGYAVPDVGKVLRCSECGRKGPAVRPNWITGD